ncbi:DUF6328 family protein [Pelomonas aquatica]|jgi:hypothetical protein|nr:DUF6328 family protein [Pelomonas aquatica]MCY4754879.1 DUF6328 family protein [Pelomonas aquatica]
MTEQDESRPLPLTGQLMDDDDGDLTDMLGELRVLLPTAQLLSAFLIAVPFAPGFRSIVQAEKNVFLATFMLSVAALVLFTAPAVQHRLMRPLRQRANFKARASRQMLVGAALLAIALVLATQFVLSEVLGHMVGNIAAACIGALIGAMWLLVPLTWNRRQAA